MIDCDGRDTVRTERIVGGLIAGKAQSCVISARRQVSVLVRRGRIPNNVNGNACAIAFQNAAHHIFNNDIGSNKVRINAALIAYRQRYGRDGEVVCVLNVNQQVVVRRILRRIYHNGISAGIDDIARVNDVVIGNRGGDDILKVIALYKTAFIHREGLRAAVVYGGVVVGSAPYHRINREFRGRNIIGEVIALRYGVIAVSARYSDVITIVCGEFCPFISANRCAGDSIG